MTENYATLCKRQNNAASKYGTNTNANIGLIPSKILVFPQTEVNCKKILLSYYTKVYFSNFKLFLIPVCLLIFNETNSNFSSIKSYKST